MNRLKFFIVVFAAVFMVSCANMVQNKVAMPMGGFSETTTLFDILGEEENNDTTVALNAPSEIIVSLFEYNDRIKISWSAVKNATSYCLERAVVKQKNANGDYSPPKDEEYETLVHTKTLYTTSYTDIIISNTARDPLDYTNEKYDYAYFYRVCAENPRGGYDASEYVVSTKGMLLPPAINVEASMGEFFDSVDIKWDAVYGATSYEVYRSMYSDGSNSIRIGTETKTCFFDSSAASYPGQEFYYKVYAISRSGAKSVESPLAMGYTLISGAPPRVTNVRIEKGTGDVKGGTDGVVIKWDPVPNDDATYTVFRSSSKDSSLTAIKRGLAANTTTYTDTDLDTAKDIDTYFYYRVQACVTEDGVEKKGPMSESGPKNDKPAEAYLLSKPSYVSVSKNAANNKITITFAAAIGDRNYINDSKYYEGKTYNTYTYKVYSCDKGGNDATEISGVKIDSNVDRNGNYVGTFTDTHQFFKMSTVLGGLESDFTEVVEPAPDRVKDVYVTRAALVGNPADYIISGTGNNDMHSEEGMNITNYKANKNGVHPVEITWTAVEGAVAYDVYRSTSWDSGFRKITTTKITDPITSGGTKFSYIDRSENAKAGNIYYYQVLSLNSLGQGTNYSEVDQPRLENIAGVSGANAKFIKIKDGGNPYGRGYGWGALSVYQWMQEQRKTTVTSQAKLTLMHKPNNMNKLGKESINGDICGTLSYDSHLDGVSGRVEMPYSNYADLYIQNNSALGIYFLFVDGNTNTSANISANGKMDGVITCKGMYPGKVRYDNVEIKGGQAGGGTYGVIREGIDSGYQEIYWLAGN